MGVDFMSAALNIVIVKVLPFSGYGLFTVHI